MLALLKAQEEAFEALQAIKDQKDALTTALKVIEEQDELQQQKFPVEKAANAPELTPMQDFSSPPPALALPPGEFQLQQRTDAVTSAAFKNGGRSVYVADFPYGVTQNQVQQLFQQYGVVVSALWHPHDHDARGYYLVQFSSSAEAICAAELNGALWAPDGLLATQLLVKQLSIRVPIQSALAESTEISSGQSGGIFKGCARQAALPIDHTTLTAKAPEWTPDFASAPPQPPLPPPQPQSLEQPTETDFHNEDFADQGAVDLATRAAGTSY
jgi:hypothetical protein